MEMISIAVLIWGNNDNLGLLFQFHHISRGPALRNTRNQSFCVAEVTENKNAELRLQNCSCTRENLPILSE